MTLPEAVFVIFYGIVYHHHHCKVYKALTEENDQSRGHKKYDVFGYYITESEQNEVSHYQYYHTYGIDPAPADP